MLNPLKRKDKLVGKQLSLGRRHGNLGKQKVADIPNIRLSPIHIDNELSDLSSDEAEEAEGEGEEAESKETKAVPSQDV